MLPGFFYFRGQAYKIEDSQKVDISTVFRQKYKYSYLLFINLINNIKNDIY